MQYRIKSDNTSLGKQGDLVDEKDVPEGIHLGALVEGGHLEVVTKTAKSSDKE